MRTALVPQGYPDGYELPAGANVAAYFDRGWCFYESRWWHERPPGDQDMIDECTKGGGRAPPIVPEDFAIALETKSFTNGKDDRPLV
eukprot:2035998-Prymnesium_polylepis.1